MAGRGGSLNWDSLNIRCATSKSVVAPLAISYHRCAMVSRVARTPGSSVVRAMATHCAALLRNSSERSGIAPHAKLRGVYAKYLSAQSRSNVNYDRAEERINTKGLDGRVPVRETTNAS